MRPFSGPFAPALQGTRRGLRPARRAVAAGAVLAAVAAPVAQAARPATADETAAIAPAVGLPANCITAQISTVDTTWATAQDTNVLPCSQADGTVILHQVNGAWTNVTAGSDFGFCPIDGVPDAISAEFALCTPVTAQDYVLGVSEYTLYGKGFGESKPRTIFNGGDPSGLVTQIHWKHWGSATATATGKNAIFKPHGGYYPHKVTIELRASDRGICDGLPAYQLLEVRSPSKPGGKLGKWFSWSGSQSICDSNS